MNHVTAKFWVDDGSNTGDTLLINFEYKDQSDLDRTLEKLHEKLDTVYPEVEYQGITSH